MRSSNRLRSKGGSEYNSDDYLNSDRYTSYRSDGQYSEQSSITNHRGQVYSERAVSSRIHDRNTNDKNSDINQIVVYLLTNKCDDSSTQKLSKFFQSSNFYDLHVVDIPPPPSIDIPNSMTEAQAIEIYRFNKVLTEASDRYPDKQVLIIKDKSVTITTPDLLEDVIRTGLQLSGWDLFYLNRWLDSCEQYTNKVEVNSSMTTLVKTISPNSTLAVLFSPRGRDIVIGRCKMNNGSYFTPISVPLGEKLNREIIKGNFTAICTVPNQFDFNMFVARNVSDLGKLCDCKRPEIKDTNDGPGTIPFIWFVIIVIIIFLAIWALYVLGPSNRRDTSNQNLEVEISRAES
jgi:hypothetical protein